MNYLMNENDIEILRSAIAKINKRLDFCVKKMTKDENAVPYQRVTPIYFWAPRFYEDKNIPGFTLYICGGDALHIYVEEDNIKCKLFDKSYDRYFKNAILIDTLMKKNKQGKEEIHQIILNPLRNKFTKETGKGPQFDSANSYKKLVDANLITDDEYIEMIEAFINVVKGTPCIASPSGRTKRPYERYRENIIAMKNCNNPEFQIMDMEFEASLEKVRTRESKKGKADLVGIQINEDKKSLGIYFIEYKCTETATAGKTSLPEHYQDMCKYYKKDDIFTRVKAMYKNRMKLVDPNWKQPEDFDNFTVSSKMLFLFSHVVDIVEKNDIRLSQNTVANKVVAMINPQDGQEIYSNEQVYFLTIDGFEENCLINPLMIRQLDKIYTQGEKESLCQKLFEDKN